MPSSGHDAMNQAIRSGRGDPADLTDHASVNASLRAAAGVTVAAPPPPLGPPPLPGEDEAAFRSWAEDAEAAGVSAKELTSYTSRWLTQHRAMLRGNQ